MITFNTGVQLKTKIKKGNIEKGSYVTVVKPLDYETRCCVQDKHGNEQVYYDYELTCFGAFINAKRACDILEKDGNYHNGYYMLPNDKEYTVTWCGGRVIIREGKDGGWYRGSGSKDVGRTIYEGEFDWQQHKKAVIMNAAYEQFTFGRKFAKQNPDILKMYCDKIKDEDRFKLHDELSEDKKFNNW